MTTRQPRHLMPEDGDLDLLLADLLHAWTRTHVRRDWEVSDASVLAEEDGFEEARAV